MSVREANKDELDEILQLYLYLHEDRVLKLQSIYEIRGIVSLVTGIIILLCVKRKGNLWHPAYV